MKTLIIASAFALASSAAVADWEDVFQNPDLSVNYQGHTVTQQSFTDDPVENVFGSSNDLYAGGDAEAIPAVGPISYDSLAHGNSDLDSCGCI